MKLVFRSGNDSRRRTSDGVRDNQKAKTADCETRQPNELSTQSEPCNDLLVTLLVIPAQEIEEFPPTCHEGQ
jgi:hypothetical protein